MNADLPSPKEVFSEHRVSGSLRAVEISATIRNGPFVRRGGGKSHTRELAQGGWHETSNAAYPGRPGRGHAKVDEVPRCRADDHISSDWLELCGVPPAPTPIFRGRLQPPARPPHHIETRRWRPEWASTTSMSTRYARVIFPTQLVPACCLQPRSGLPRSTRIGRVLVGSMTLKGAAVLSLPSEGPSLHIHRSSPGDRWRRIVGHPH